MAVTAIVALIAALGAVISAISFAPRSSAQTPGIGVPFDCTGNTIYNVQTTATPTSTPSRLNALAVGSMAGTAAVTGTQISAALPQNAPNALGISPGGTAAWALSPQFPTSSGSGATAALTFQIRQYDPLTQVWTTHTAVVPTAGRLPAGLSNSTIVSGGIVAGAIDPLSHNYYWAYYGSASSSAPRGSITFFGWDTTTNTSLGIVAISTLPQTGTIGTGGANGDFAFSAAGHVLVVSNVGTNAALGAIASGLPTAPQTTPPSLEDVNLATYLNPSSNSYNGIAFNNTGGLFLQYTTSGGATQLLKVDPESGNIEAGPSTINYATPGALLGTDLGACSVPPVIQLRKTVVSRATDTDQFNLSITGDAVQNGNTVTTDGPPTGPQTAFAGPVVGTTGTTYRFTETGAGTTLLSDYSTTYRCVDQGVTPNLVLVGSTAVTGTMERSFTLTLPPPQPSQEGQVIVCTFTNRAPTLTLVKTVNNGATGQTTAATAWTLAANGPRQTISGSTASAAVTGRGVPPGTYNLSESGPSGFTPSAWTCAGAQSFTASSVTLALDQDATCTIDNVAIPPKLTLVKVVRNGLIGATGVATDWTLTATGPTTITGVTGSPAVTGVTAHVGTYALSESGPAGYTASVWHCTGAASSTPTSVTLALGQSATCTIINKAIPPTITFTKRVVSVTQQTNGTWTVVYEVVVSNTGAVNGVYALTDTLRFGTGITVNSASATGPSTQAAGWNGTTDTTLGTAVPLAAGGIHTYTLTVNATVPSADFVSGTAECPAAGSTATGGFNNEAGLTVNGQTSTEVACDEPSQPRLEKQFVSAVQNPVAPTEFSVSYLLTVDNSGQPHANFFTLTDTPSFSPGVTITAATVNGTTVPFAPPPLIVVGTPTSIAAGAVLQYTLTFTVTVDSTAPGFSADCTAAGAGNGFFNAATLTTGGNSLTADDCGDIAAAVNPTIAKAVTGIAQNADGTWTIAYAVTVSQPATGPENPSGLSSLYDLSDTLNFGGGITINSASWTGPTSGTFALPATTATLATGQTIAAGATDTYTVTVNATVTQAAITNGTTACDDAETPTAGGFLNQATLTVAGEPPEHVFACGEPAFLTVTKTAATPTFDPATGHWTITYTVTVTNDTTLDQFYNLSDAPAFPAGVTIVSGSATGPGGPITGWNGTSDTTLGTAVPIAGATAAGPTVHTYMLMVVAAVSGVTASTPVDCVASTPGAGFFNQATLSQGPVDSTADACEDIPVPTITHTKTVESVRQQPNGTWTVVYAITVTNAGDVGGVYSLTDTLRFGTGITVNTADWSLNGGGSNPFTSPQTLATNRPLDVNGTDVYIVTVNATMGAAVMSGPQRLCPAPGSSASGAFNNEAGLTVNGETINEEACAEPSAPSIEKTFLTANQNITDAAAWTVSYLLTVNNSGHTNANFFTLTDTPAFSPGVTITGASVDGTPVTFTPPTLTVVAVPSEIPAGAIRTFRVAFTVTVDRTAAGFTAQCSSPPAAGKGFFNAATLTTGEDEVHTEDCGSIPDPVAPSVAKTVASTVQQANGTWTITYTLTVTMPAPGSPANQAGYSGLYNLSDTLKFGGGITINTAEFGGPTGVGSWPAPNTTPTAVLATARTIPAGVTDRYTIVVNASVSHSAFTSNTASCTGTATPSAGGFLNTAMLMAQGSTAHAFACSQPVAPPSPITPRPTLPVTG
jgi:hypothetical protein